MTIEGFMHIYAANNWRQIVNNQIDKITRSGLMEKIDFLNIGMVYQTNERPDREFLYELPKAFLLYCLKNPEYEQSLTLCSLWLHCCENDGYVFYIHTKGVSHINKTKLYQDDWRNMMEHFIIERQEECLHYLNVTKADVVGVNWHLGDGYMGASPRMCGGLKATSHFSGNFWWARNSYIRTLPDPFPIKQSKYECEFWIGLNKPKVVELWNSGTHHHRNSYPEEMYFGKKQISFFNM